MKTSFIAHRVRSNINIHPDPMRLTAVGLAAKCFVAVVVANAFAPPAFAAAIPLAQAPAGTGGREPAPNVILSLDDSGSMGWDVFGCLTPKMRPEYGELIDIGAVCPPPFDKRGTNPRLSRIEGLQNALIAQFGDPTANPPTLGKIEDGRIRLAWQTMHNNGNSPGAENLTPGAENSIKPFQGAHRLNFYKFVKKIKAWNGTPSHALMKNTRDYMMTAPGINSPWAFSPGITETPYMACRRTYNILMTDGAWNQDDGLTVGNADGTSRTLPDGTAYSPTSNQVRVYRDNWGAGAPSTLSDWAFANWATDLQPTIPNSVRSDPTTYKEKSTVLIGGENIQPYWNPRNNPASWQHVAQHTIGFGQRSFGWTGAPVWNAVTDDNYGGDYSSLVSGAIGWQDPVAGGEAVRPSELWHMALNGRGKFYPARTPEALTAAFSDILDNVINDTSQPLVSISASSARVTGDTKAYIAGYDGSDWSGSVKAYGITATGLAVTPDWNAADKLDATLSPETRTILTSNGANGIPFKWASLPSTAPAIQRTALNSSDGRGSDRLDYLRGVRTGEGIDSGKFRRRTTRLGDIVNSNIWYLGRPRAASPLPGYSTFASSKAARTPMIYVGANDGMLHGFDASDKAPGLANAGLERIAYVPLGAYANLAGYTSQSYSHRYTVDGSPFSGDVLVSTGNWRTYLAGFLSGGGKGYFLLDVTDPSQFSESNAASLVVLDTTATADPDIGQIFPQPSKAPVNANRNVQFTMMNNNRPALILGNGVNSTNEKAVLLIQYLDGNTPSIKRISTSTTVGQGNGLSNPQVLDLNNDGKADIVYAGDLKGNMWKFDVTSATEGNWKVSFSGSPLFTATSSTNTVQPILTAPVWLPHPKTGIQLGFGTGRNITVGDRIDTSEQTFYAVWDNSTINKTATGIELIETAANTVSGGRSSLVEQTMGAAAVASYGGRSFYNSDTASPVNYNTTGSPVPNSRRGWFMKFTESKERASNNPSWFVDNYVIVPTAIPSAGTESNTETCSPESSKEKGYITVVDLINGSAPKKPIFDTNGGGITVTDTNANKMSDVGDMVYVKNKDGTSGLLTANGIPPVAPPVGNPLSTGWRDR